MDLKISDLNKGDTAEITGLDTADSAYRTRISAMGLTKGTVLSVVKIAPLGDPVEIDVRGYRLSLRKNEASVIRLRRI